MSTVAGQHEGSPVAGWYADPQGTGHRWWDGTQWTDHVQAPVPVAQVAQVAPVPQASPWSPAGGGTGAGFAPVADSPVDGSYGAAGQFGAPAGQYGAAAGQYGAPAGQYGAPTQYGAPVGQFGDASPYGASGAPAAYGTPPALKNTSATVSLVLGTVSFALGILTGLWFASIITILLASNGLQTAKTFAAQGHPPVGRARSAWGLGLGILSMVLVIVAKLSDL